MSGTLAGAGGIGGLLARSAGGNAATGEWTSHRYAHTMPGDAQRTVTEDGSSACDGAAFRNREDLPAAPRATARSQRSQMPLGVGLIGGLLTRSHGYRASDGAWSTHNYCHADGNGNITALAGASGALSASYRYDPCGRPRSLTGSMASANPLRFSSKPWIGFNNSNSTGLCYFGYRWYDPYLQRWLSRDPLSDIGFGTLRRNLSSVLDSGPNSYLFVRNSPINGMDPHGLRVTWWGAFRDDDVPASARGCYNKCVQKLDALPFFAGTYSGFVGGVTSGMVIGSVFPGIGTVAVGVISGVVGVVSGWAGTYMSAKEIDKECTP